MDNTKYPLLQKRVKMLKEADERGANLSPIDFELIDLYESLVPTKPAIDLNNITEPTEVMFEGEKVTVVGKRNKKETQFDYIIQGFSTGHDGYRTDYTYFPGYSSGGFDKQYVNAEELSLIEKEDK